VDELVDTVVLVRTHPWRVVPLGGDSPGSEADWREAERESVELIKSMAASDVGFGHRLDEVWSILHNEVNRRDELSGVASDVDPLESAINRPCTRALQAALVFMGYEYRVDQRVRPEALQLLTSVLELPDRDGAEHRAILATGVRFLRRIAPSWMEQHREQLFGDAAPSDLGQQTIDLALKWGQPDNWLLESYSPKVLDAVRRNVENALEQYLIAMLRQLPEYSIKDAVTTLRSMNRISEAAEALGRLLRSEKAPAEAVNTATEYWTRVVATHQREDLAGFGWFAEIPAIDGDTWEDLTLATLDKNQGRIDWAHKVAERAAARPLSTRTLSIMNAIVRSNIDEWDRRSIGQLGVQMLEQSTSLSDTPAYDRLRTTLLERGHM
jgi:hypothetical protein